LDESQVLPASRGHSLKTSGRQSGRPAAD